MYSEGCMTHIPSRVICLPPPLLTPSLSWAAVQPSPDRTSVLLRGLHECQLLRLTPSTEDSKRDVSSTVKTWDAQRGACVTLPQPHRRLTASCWVSVGADEVNTQSSDSSGRGEAAALGAVVALGDDQSTVSVLRATHSSTHSHERSAVEWTQSSMFLHDAHSRLFAAGTPALSSLAKPSLCTPAWKAVETILHCQHTPLLSNDDERHSAGAADAYIICQRSGEVLYDGDGAALASARVTTHGVWMASVSRETAWMVPLTMPDEDADEDDNDGRRRKCIAISGKTINAGATARAAISVGDGSARRGLRIFDVHRRAPSAFNSDLAAPQRESSGRNSIRTLHPLRGAGPTAGCVFAAASRRHVGLFSTSSVKLAVLFKLPESTHYSACATQGCPSLSMSPRSGRWVVTSVLEAPPSAPAASPAAHASPYAYLVTASRARSSGHGTSMGTTDQERWWLLYDCRMPSAPVWAVEAPRSSAEVKSSTAGAPELSFFDDTTEWLCPAMPMAASAAPLICASYLPGAGARQKGGEPLRTSTAGSPPGVCMLLSCGADALSSLGREEGDRQVHKRPRTRVQPTWPAADAETVGASDFHAAPCMYGLAPPPSLASPQKGSACRVRALSYSDNTLLYLSTRS
ncbi:hypothetical protein ABL78_6809 [Leptomonas seymouri]|uniref:Uncharacterized protein n=1 Tax=Leptomonas seymouri TaxID=5684 RepID=A0A0N1PCQ8_LEPSE|nr:hypothetical protein ABL78_6809 [Leptomonas seymouri]|eukprot:KPI84135.1 hypothetical protein ABL78_6809 [Leptomonas seymouri]